MSKEDLLRKAELLQNSQVSKREAVMSFGSHAQQEHFKKYGTFTNKRVEEALIKTLNQCFESVEKVKNGRSIEYQLGSARADIAEREINIGGNATNGNWNPQTRHLDALVLAQLEWNMQNDEEIEMPLNHWLYSFGLINDEQMDLVSSGYSKEGRERTKELIMSHIGSNVVSSDFEDIQYLYEARSFFYDDYSNKKNTLMSTLRRLEKENIIQVLKIPAIYYKEKKENGDTYERISTVKYQEYKDKEKELMKKHDIEPNMLSKIGYYADMANRKTNNKSYDRLVRIRGFQKEMSEFLENEYVTEEKYGVIKPTPVRNVGIRIGIVSIASKKRVAKYLEKYSPEILEEYIKFKEDRSDYFNNQALEYREKNRANRLNRVERKKERAVTKTQEEMNRITWFSGEGKEEWEEKELRKTQQFYLNIMSLVESLDLVYCENFKNEKLRNKMSKREKYKAKCKE